MRFYTIDGFGRYSLLELALQLSRYGVDNTEFQSISDLPLGKHFIFAAVVVKRIS